MATRTTAQVHEEDEILKRVSFRSLLTYRMEKNRANLERFVGYSLDRGLMAKKMAVEELFLTIN